MQTFNKVIWAVFSTWANFMSRLGAVVGRPAQALFRARASRGLFLLLLRFGIHPYAAALVVTGAVHLLGVVQVKTGVFPPGTVLWFVLGGAVLSLLLVSSAIGAPCKHGEVLAVRQGRRGLSLHLGATAEHPFSSKSAVQGAVMELARSGARKLVLDSPLLVSESLSRRTAAQLQKVVASLGLSARCSVEEPAYWNVVKSACFVPYLQYQDADKFSWKNKHQLLSRRITVEICNPA